MANKRKYVMNQPENEELEAQFLNYCYILVAHCIETGSEKKSVRLTSIRPRQGTGLYPFTLIYNKLQDLALSCCPTYWFV